MQNSLAGNELSILSIKSHISIYKYSSLSISFFTHKLTTYSLFLFRFPHTTLSLSLNDMDDNMDPPPSSEEEEYDGLEEGQEGQDEDDQDKEEGEEEEEDQDEEAGEDEDDEEYHGRRAVVLFPPNKPKEEVMKFYNDALDAKDMQEEHDDDGHYLSFYVPGFFFNNKNFPYCNHEITRVLFNVKDENGNDMPYYESRDARSKRGIRCWSNLKYLAQTAGMTLEDDGITMRDKYLNTWTLVDSFNTPEGSIEGEKEEENDEDDMYDSENDYNQVYNKSDEEDVGPDPEGTYNDDSDGA